MALSLDCASLSYYKHEHLRFDYYEKSERKKWIVDIDIIINSRNRNAPKWRNVFFDLLINKKRNRLFRFYHYYYQGNLGKHAKPLLAR